MGNQQEFSNPWIIKKKNYNAHTQGIDTHAILTNSNDKLSRIWDLNPSVLYSIGTRAGKVGICVVPISPTNPTQDNNT